ncbi:hypothetical protein JCM2421_15500 [Staphylococcus auricularis]|nr:hypothetical protein JCM2421_15500 [Staphylococcus auricularis]SQJ14118.1 nitroreductase [Staphylococcus auricularis]
MGLFNNSNKDLKTFQDAVEARRSIYDLEKEVSISDDEIKSIIEHTVKHVPSAFNSQSTRIVLLLNDNHEKFWDITKEELKKQWTQIVISNLLLIKLITSNIHTVQCYSLKIKTL